MEPLRSSTSPRLSGMRLPVETGGGVVMAISMMRSVGASMEIKFTSAFMVTV